MYFHGFVMVSTQNIFSLDLLIIYHFSCHSKSFSSQLPPNSCIPHECYILIKRIISWGNLSPFPSTKRFYVVRCFWENEIREGIMILRNSTFYSADCNSNPLLVLITRAIRCLFILSKRMYAQHYISATI